MLNVRVNKIFLYFLVLPNFVGAFVALFAPYDILEKLLFLQPGVNLMTEFLPAMSERIAMSKIPQILAVTYLISWFSLPIQFVLFLVYLNSSDIVFNLKNKSRNIFKSALMFYACFAILFFYNVVIGWHEFNYLGIDPLNTRFGVALVGGFGFFLMSSSLAFALKLTFANIASESGENE